MKKLEIIIRPSMFDKVKDTLTDMGIHGLNYVEIKGFGRQRGHTEVYRGTTMQVDCLPKIKVEIVVKGDDVDRCVEAIVRAARTGKIGDGKIFVSPVERVVRIRTGEEDEAAV